MKIVFTIKELKKFLAEYGNITVKELIEKRLS